MNFVKFGLSSFSLGLVIRMFKVIISYVHLFDVLMQDDDDDDWFPEDLFEAFEEMRKRKVFDVSDMYTIADAWGWTWDSEIKNRSPQKWSQEWEVELAVQLMQKACSYTFCFLLSSNLSSVIFKPKYSFCVFFSLMVNGYIWNQLLS